MKITLNWAEMKEQLTRGMPYRYISRQGFYNIYAVDDPFQFECLIQQNNGDDHLDFETNYKTAAFSTFSQFDTDGAQIVRAKAAKRGWSFWSLPIEVTTSSIGGTLFCQDSSGSNIPGVSCKIYDNNNSEITTPGLLNANLNTCVKTVIDFEPAFDYEIIGGELRINSNPAQDVRMWIIGAPDIPAIAGGSKEFASGVNLKFLAPDSGFSVDGRVTKYIQYNGVDHRGKLRILLKHPAGSQINLQFVVHMYRL
jgi:hypothetical protein